MAEGRSVADWSHTSVVLTALCNPNRDTKKHPTPYTPDDFNPHAKRKAKVVEQVDIKEIKGLFLKMAANVSRPPLPPPPSR